MIQERLDALKNRAHELDKMILGFVSECESIAKELTNRLSKRRKRYRLSVKVDQRVDLHRYEFDIYINERYFVLSYPVDFDEDFDDEEILKECDRFYWRLLDELDR